MKFGFLSTSAAPPREAFIWGKGQPEGTGFVQNGIEEAVGRGRNPAQLFRVDEGIGNAGLVPVKDGRGWLGSRLRLGDLRRGGWGFRGVNGVPWLLTHRLVLRFAAPLRVVDLCLDERGLGLRPGGGKGGGPGSGLRSL
jgi:hypothetical protein